MGAVTGTVVGYFGGLTTVALHAFATESQANIGSAAAASMGGGIVGGATGAIIAERHQLFGPPKVQNPQ